MWLCGCVWLYVDVWEVRYTSSDVCVMYLVFLLLLLLVVLLLLLRLLLLRCRCYWLREQQLEQQLLQLQRQWWRDAHRRAQ